MKQRKKRNRGTCSVDGCKDTIQGRGYCNKHYFRFIRHGSTDKPKNRRDKLLEKGMSYCPKCNEEKLIKCFHIDNNTYTRFAIYCKKCSQITAKKRYKNSKRKCRNYKLYSDFGITIEEYEIMLQNQNFKCAICEKQSKKNKKVLAVDHNHKTGENRGLLCDNCNFGLGQFKDDVELLKKAINYLKKQKGGVR